MPAPITEILVILALILANGLFAMAEIAIVSARKERLQAMVAEGRAGAMTALDMANDPNRFLSTIQVGITLVGILAGAFGGATLAGRLSDVVDDVPGLSRYSDAISFGAVVIVIAYLTVVIGELVPKRLGLRSPENVAASVAPSMRRLSWLASPVVGLLSLSTNTVLRVLNLSGPVDQPVTEEEIKVLMRQGLRAGSFEAGEQQMVSGVFSLHDRPVGAFMTPRLDIVWLDAGATRDELISTIRQVKYSQFPVCEGALDDPIGVAALKDLLAWTLEGDDMDFRASTGPALFIPETATGSDVLNLFLETDNSVALVIDEHGAVEGMVTVDDILKQIVGEDAQEIVRAGDSWVVDGSVVIERLNEVLPAPIQVPEGERGRYHTMSGFVMARLGRIPEVGDSFTWDGVDFEVQMMSDNRVARVRITPQEDVTDDDQL
jgi:putative hemolysin